MTSDYIALEDWVGDELYEEYIDFVIAGTKEAKAIASYRTGKMVNSVRIRKVSDGFEVISDRSVLKSYGGKSYYTYVYAKLGYPASRIDPFHFIKQGFENVADIEVTYRNGKWRAVNPSNRRGSGTSYLGKENIAFVQGLKRKYKSQAERRTGPARLLFSKYK